MLTLLLQVMYPFHKHEFVKLFCYFICMANPTFLSAHVLLNIIQVRDERLFL